MIKARYENKIVECVPLAVYDDLIYTEIISFYGINGQQENGYIV